MKRIAKRSYTEQYKQEAVRLAGEVGVAEAGRRLEISAKTLANWVRLLRSGRALGSDKRAPVTEMEAELARLRAENARLRMEREILKNRLRGRPRPICLETGGYTGVTQGQWPFAFWRHLSPSKNLAQGKPRTQLWRHFV